MPSRQSIKESYDVSASSVRAGRGVGPMHRVHVCRVQRPALEDNQSSLLLPYLEECKAMAVARGNPATEYTIQTDYLGYFVVEWGAVIRVDDELFSAWKDGWRATFPQLDACSITVTSSSTVRLKCPRIMSSMMATASRPRRFLTRLLLWMVSYTMLLWYLLSFLLHRHWQRYAVYYASLYLAWYK